MDMKEELQNRVNFLLKAQDNVELQTIEMELCKKDIMHFFRNYLYTDKNANLFTGDEPNVIPFIPFEFQEELIEEVRSSIINGTKSFEERDDLTNVFIEKSRQMGISWLVMAIFAYGYLFHNHKYLVISQKEEDVDKIGDMKSLFEKIRFMLRNLPKRMLPEGFTLGSGSEYNKYKSISRADGTGSITGESANPNASRGGTYNAIFLDEMAFMQNATTINTAAASATPCRIFNSTPNGQGNEFYRMKKLTVDRIDEDTGEKLQADIKGLRYHWTDHPHYDSNWYKWKIQGMTKEKIAQELEIDYNTAIKGRVYPDLAPDPILIEYKPELPLYIAIDNSHGGVDPHAILIIQPEDHYYNIIDSMEINCTPRECADYLSGQPRFQMTNSQQNFLERYTKYHRQRAIFISDPYDTKVAMGNSTILDDYREVGINLFLPQNRDKKQQIQKTKTSIDRIRYNHYCKEFATAILNSRYPEVKEDSNRTTAQELPVHNWTSHYRTALEYFITYISENPILNVKKDRILKDTRPRRDVTGKLIYQKL